ncbi:MAG: hypothetical protein ACLQQ4_10025, partial [Bacteroidia bacterium]
PPSNNPSVASAPGINQLLGANMFGNVYSIPLNDSGNTVLTGNGNFVNIDSLQKNQNLWQQNDTNIYYNSGYVGIGTNNPQYPLEVSGNAAITGNIYGQNIYAANNLSAGNFRFVNGAVVGTADSIVSSAPALQLSATNVKVTTDTFSVSSNLSVTANSVAMPGIVTDTTADLMQIDTHGNVTPLSEVALQNMVNPAWPITGIVPPSNPCSGAIPWTFTKSFIGNAVEATVPCTWVGIGLNTPDAPLTISNNRSALQFTIVPQLASGGVGPDVFTIDNAGNTFSAGTLTLFNQTSNINIFTVDNSGNTFAYGNVGIGTPSTPTSALTISNPAITNQIAVTNTSGNLFTVDNAGNSVIGGNLSINGVPYFWPTVQAAGVLTSDATGHLSWGNGGGTDAWSNATFTSTVTGNIWYNGGGSGGNVGINTTTPQDAFQVNDGFNKICIGNASGISATSQIYGSNYIGFNAARQSSTGLWQANTNGFNNGGNVILGDVAGNLYFAAIPSLPEATGGGDNPQTISDAALFGSQSNPTNNIRLFVGATGNVGIGTIAPIGSFQVNNGVGAVNIGSINESSNSGFITTYISFNSGRGSSGLWQTNSDDYTNGGAMIMGDVGGNIYFSSINSTGNGQYGTQG